MIRQDQMRLVADQEAIADVDARAKFTQEMVDQVFSFGELGFQEVETSRYLTGQLEKYGFAEQLVGLAAQPLQAARARQQRAA